LTTRTAPAGDRLQLPQEVVVGMAIRHAGLLWLIRQLLVPSGATLVAAEPGAVRVGVGHAQGPGRVLAAGFGWVGVGLAGVAAGPGVLGVTAEHAGVGGAVIAVHRCLL
jgi:hypothetical protein